MKSVSRWFKEKTTYNKIKMRFEFVEHEEPCGCKKTYTERDTFHSYTDRDYSYSYCSKHLQESVERAKYYKECRRKEEELRQKEGVVCECGVKYHPAVDKYHEHQTQHKTFLKNKYADEVRATPTSTWVPVKLAVLKYREAYPNQSSTDVYVRNSLIKISKNVLEVKRERGRYYCSGERLEVVDFTRLE